jgi:hypothetical protein
MEHHIGLVLARRAREAAGDPVPAWEAMRKRFAAEVDAHFILEEQGLLPALAAVGERALVERTLAEHRSLRALIGTGGPADLAAFALLLADHIRFEEDELFATAERVLSDENLATIEALHASAPRATPG